MTDIFIVRHGNTFDPGDTVTRVGARTDLELSRSGRDQAQALASHFSDFLPRGFARACCSALLRTRQTAETILSAFPDSPAIEVLPFLREIDYGPDENMPEDRVRLRVGEEALRKWDEEATPPPGWQVDPTRLSADWAALFREIASTPLEGPVLLVTSNGVARFALDALSEGRDAATDIKLKTGAYGLVRVSSQGPALISWNVRPPANVS